LLNCFAGCPYSAIARAVGIASPTPRAARRFTSPLEEARATVLAEARRQPWTWARETYAMNRAVRDGRRRASEIRAATAIRLDWDELARAATLETYLAALEHALETA